MTPRTKCIAIALLATAATGLAGAGCGASGSSSVDPERFAKRFVRAGDQTAWAVHALDDGGYLIVGSSAAESSAQRNPWILRTDARARVRWELLLEDEADEVARGTLRISDDEFLVLVGRVLETVDGGPSPGSAPLRTRVRVMSIDGDGAFREDFVLPEDRSYRGLARLRDGGLAIIANPVETRVLADDEVLVVERDGRERWRATLGDGIGESREDFVGLGGLLGAADGDLLVSGSTPHLPFKNGGDAFLARYSPEGSLRWQTVFVESNDNKDASAGTIVEGADGDLTAIGFRLGDAVRQRGGSAILVRTDADGLPGERAYAPGVGGYTIPEGLVTTSDGGLATLTRAGPSQLARFDADEALLWTRDLPGAIRPRALAATPDGGFAVLAVTPALSIDGPGDVMLIRTEADGALPPSLIVDE